MRIDPYWKRIQELIESAEAMPAGARAEWLAAQEPDEGVRAEVLELMEAMAEEAGAGRLRATEAPAAPAEIGPYRILGRVGAGGRGVVYAAERDVAGGTQAVALKVLPDHLIAPGDLDRFQREQRILAGLHHPAICRFLDAGWEADGRPYLVLEWIDGAAVDLYCEREGLGEAERIRLMAVVLDAVQAAHQCLVVHLDLKPSNILIDRHGNPRLIDFGTAKLLAEDAASTSTRQLTPRYASPEQLRGEPVSTASDIYSAALTLYELVAGPGVARLRSSLAALAERATGAGVEVALAGRPDLEAVLGKALEADPRRRYRTAAEFADDLRAYLEGRPVTARRPTAAYRFSRFVRRHRGAAATVALLVAALAGVGGFAAAEQRRRTEETRRAAETGRFLLWMIESSATPHAGKAQVTMLDMAQRAHQRIEEGWGPPDDVAAQVQASLAYVARESGREDVGEPMARAALARAERSGVAEARIGARQTLAEIVIRRGRCPEATALYGEADALLAGARLRDQPAAVYLGARGAARLRCEADPEGARPILNEGLRRGAGATAVVRASIQLTRAMALARLRRFDSARSAIAAGLREAASHPDGRYLEIALLRTGAQVETAAGAPGKAVELLRQVGARAAGVVSVFEELRLGGLLAGAMAEAGDVAGAGRQLEASLRETRRRRTEVGPSYWMLIADAAEVQGRRRRCEEMRILYSEVEELTGGKMPRDWRANRLYFEAECAAGAGQARLAAEALRAYGALLPPESKRGRRLRELAKE